MKLFDKDEEEADEETPKATKGRQEIIMKTPNAGHDDLEDVAPQNDPTDTQVHVVRDWRPPNYYGRPFYIRAQLSQEGRRCSGTPCV